MVNEKGSRSYFWQIGIGPTKFIYFSRKRFLAQIVCLQIAINVKVEFKKQVIFTLTEINKNESFQRCGYFF